MVDDIKFAEGPAWHPDGYLLFQDTGRNRTLRVDESGKVTVFRDPSGRTNALALDSDCRLVAAESHGDGGARRVSRLEAHGEWVTLADRFEGAMFNSPNDLAIDARGRIYFTDPRYTKRETMQLAHESVYRIDPGGTLVQVVTSLARPNGILITADGRTLLLANNAHPDSPVTLCGFDLEESGAATNERVLYDFRSGRGIDGMTLDRDGRVWAAAGTGDRAGVYVFELDAARRAAEMVEFIALPEEPTNCTFGGAGRDILYITGATALYRVRTDVRGRTGLPGK